MSTSRVHLTVILTRGLSGKMEIVSVSPSAGRSHMFTVKRADQRSQRVPACKGRRKRSTPCTFYSRPLCRHLRSSRISLFHEALHGKISRVLSLTHFWLLLSSCRLDSCCCLVRARREAVHSLRMAREPNAGTHRSAELAFAPRTCLSELDFIHVNIWTYVAQISSLDVFMLLCRATIHSTWDDTTLQV